METVQTWKDSYNRKVHMHFMCVCIVLPAILMPTQKVYMRNDESSPTLMCWLAIRRPPLYSTDRIMMLPLRPLWNTHTHTRKTFSRAVWLWQVGYVMSVFLSQQCLQLSKHTDGFMYSLALYGELDNTLLWWNILHTPTCQVRCCGFVTNLKYEGQKAEASVQRFIS